MQSVLELNAILGSEKLKPIPDSPLLADLQAVDGVELAREEKNKYGYPLLCVCGKAFNASEVYQILTSRGYSIRKSGIRWHEVDSSEAFIENERKKEPVNAGV